MVTVGYLRLSREDGDNTESESISNQRKIIERYAKENGIKIDRFYVDDGVSGYTMDRPQFNMIKAGLNNDTIDQIIAKDLSRIGRHNAKTNLFLEKIIESGKCVITISENYHSYSETANDILGIQTWANEKYIRDTSKKVIRSIRSLQEEGNYISSVPYGYIINPNKKGDYYPDKRVTKYVKMVFDMYINGAGFVAIVRHLTKIGAPTQTMLMKQDIEARGDVYKGHMATEWNVSTVKAMIKNDFYIGTLTLNKTRRRSINGKKVKQSADNHLVFPNRHEPIIDVDTFNLAQEIYQERTKGNYRGKRVKTRANIFAGFLVCADCGKKLTSTMNDKNTRYVCITYNKLGTDYCQSHCIREYEVRDSLILFLEQCQANIDKVLENLDSIINKELERISEDDNDIDVIKENIKKYEAELQQLIQQKTVDIISNPSVKDIIENSYTKIIDEKCQMIKSLKLQLDDCMSTGKEFTDSRNNLITAKGIFQSIINTKEITKKQVASIIDKIVVYEDGGMDFHLKGDLDKIVTNKMGVQLCERIKMVENLYQYLFVDTPDIISPTGGWKYATSVGEIRIGYPNYKKFFEEFVKEGYLEYIGYNKGYRVATTKEQFCNDCSLNTDGKFTTCLPDNDVILVIIKGVNRWIGSSSINTRKKLF